MSNQKLFRMCLLILIKLILTPNDDFTLLKCNSEDLDQTATTRIVRTGFKLINKSLASRNDCYMHSEKFLCIEIPT